MFDNAKGSNKAICGGIWNKTAKDNNIGQLFGGTTFTGYSFIMVLVIEIHNDCLRLGTVTAVYT